VSEYIIAYSSLYLFKLITYSENFDLKGLANERTILYWEI